MQRRGRVGKAEITGIGIVGWPASGHPFGVKKSHNNVPNTNSKEKAEMSSISSILTSLGLAFTQAAKSADVDPAPEANDTQADQPAGDQPEFVSKSDFDALVKTVNDLTEAQKSFSTEVETGFQSIAEIIKGIQDSNATSATEAKKSFESISEQLKSVQTNVSKMADHVPAGQDLKPETPTDPSELDDNQIYKGSPFDRMLKSLRGK